MQHYGYSYYHMPGVRDVCHKVKQSDDLRARKEAILVIARELVLRNIVRENDILIPAPQHTGSAEYTKKIAKIIASYTHAYVADVLKCLPHVPIYNAKQNGTITAIKIYLDGNLPAAKNYYFVDNVISTGLTFRLSNEVCDYKLKPLVYAVDETKSPDIGKDSILVYKQEEIVNH